MLAVFEVLQGGCTWSAGNRFWGSDDPTDHVSKVEACIFLGGVYALFLILWGFPAWPVAAASVMISSAGFWIGREDDGVRGTFMDKAIRGWRYGGIYVGYALLLKSWILLAPMLFFWQSGLIHWTIKSISARTGVWDYVPLAEATDGFVRGALLTAALLLAHRF
jgi:hypothetical protein